MKRSAPLRRTPLNRGTSQLKRTRLNPVSDKRRGEKDERDAVRSEVFARDRGCRGAALVPGVRCSGARVAHEHLQRSVYPGSHLNADMAMELCDAHHHWIDNHIAEAHEVGLLERSSFERDGMARRLR